MKTIQQVKSSQLQEVEYDSETSKLIVTFNNGSKYSYDDVPEKVFIELVSAPSIGSYFIKNIKSKYKYTKIA